MPKNNDYDQDQVECNATKLNIENIRLCISSRKDVVEFKRNSSESTFSRVRKRLGL